MEKLIEIIMRPEDYNDVFPNRAVCPNYVKGVVQKLI